MQKIDVATWKRKSHFEFFQSFEEPYFGITTKLEVSRSYAHCKSQKKSFFLYYLHATLTAANGIENFKYRIDASGQPYICRQVDASATIMRADETFGFSYIPYHPDYSVFAESATEEIKRVKESEALFPDFNPDHVLHCSAIPWLDFTGITHSRAFKQKDSVPKVSYGKVVEDQGKYYMSIAVFAHHGLMDGLHISNFFKALQQLL